MTAHPIQLIVGLGNPGPDYQATRHNAGQWLVERLANDHQVKLKSDTKFQGLYGKAVINNHSVHLLIPTTYMNNSGQALKAVAKFYRIPVEAILVVHDELDLDPGVVRLKESGGHGGHNGLRDIINHLHSKDFCRLRIGIGHPGHKDEVHDYVLKRASKAEQQQIDYAIDDAMRILPQVISGDIQNAMTALHTN